MVWCGFNAEDDVVAGGAQGVGLLLARIFVFPTGAGPGGGGGRVLVVTNVLVANIGDGHGLVRDFSWWSRDVG